MRWRVEADVQSLDSLMQAIESDGTSIDLGRINGILARVEPRPAQAAGQLGQLGQLGQPAQIV